MTRLGHKGLTDSAMFKEISHEANECREPQRSQGGQLAVHPKSLGPYGLS